MLIKLAKVLINLSFNSKIKGHIPKQADNTINFHSFIHMISGKNEAFFLTFNFTDEETDKRL